MAPETSSHYTLKQKSVILLAGVVGEFLIRLLNATARWRVEGAPALQELRRRGQPVILCFWHNQIFSATYHFRRQGIVVMTSRHFDGEYIGRIIRRLGFRTARGSSTRGGTRALLELRRWLERGSDVGFALDGPRGPLYRVKPGPILLSRVAQAPIVPFHIEAGRYWKLRSWDGFRIPWPFARTLVLIGPPLQVAEGQREEEAMRALQAELDRLKAEAERSVRGNGEG